MGIRPEHLRRADASRAAVSGRLELVEQLGEYALAHLISPAGTEFIAKMETPPAESHGATLHFDADLARVHLFGTDEQRIAR